MWLQFRIGHNYLVLGWDVISCILLRILFEYERKVGQTGLMEGTKIVLWFVTFVSLFWDLENVQECSDCKVWYKLCFIRLSLKWCCLNHMGHQSWTFWHYWKIFKEQWLLWCNSYWSLSKLSHEIRTGCTSSDTIRPGYKRLSNTIIVIICISFKI